MTDERPDLLIDPDNYNEEQFMAIREYEKSLIISWPIAMTVIALIVAASFGAWMYLWNSHWTALFGQVKEGCANPDNHFAQISIVLSHDQIWKCTPFYKQGAAPKKQ